MDNDDSAYTAAWQVTFVLVNLLALGLTGWVLDSVHSWGYTLTGLKLLDALGVTALLVLSSVFGTGGLWIRRKAAQQVTDCDDSTATTESEDSGDEDHSDVTGGRGSTDDESGYDIPEPTPIDEAGDDLPEATTQQSESSTTSGNFAVERFTPGDDSG
ncbi:hypothetical protein VB773_19800 [Haloarculaceae archaeon H-GB2-1]|nr:hypothetical protein [Haloarculaceae archaeon H-GB1-1]MEA5409599.1 hypothetical protein [Haloarculaceae archaeon H-GB2-1]